MSGYPMARGEYAAAMRGIELAAEYHATQRRIDAGHEFAALMEPGGTVRISGEDRTIEEIETAPQDRVVIRCTDGTEWLARRSATRPYSPPAPGGHEGAPE